MIFSSFFTCDFCGNCLVNAVFWWLGCGEKRGKDGLLMVVIFGIGGFSMGRRWFWARRVVLVKPDWDQRSLRN